MLFGFVPATVAGFLLTAIPTWTGRRPIQGGFLAGLAVVWILGRLAVLLSRWLPIWLSATVDVSFLLLLAGTAANEIIVSRNWRNVAMPLPILALAVANLLMHLELAGAAVSPGLGWRLGLAAIMILISVIGGRIIPAFTRNWLVTRRSPSVPAAHSLLDSVSLGLLHAGLIGWAFAPQFGPIGILLILAALANCPKLLRWQALRTFAEPLLTILHVGYLWLIAGSALLGASMFTNLVPLSAAIHAMTAGAIGTMILAVMTRVSLGHTGRPLHADAIDQPDLRDGHSRGHYADRCGVHRDILHAVVGAFGGVVDCGIRHFYHPVRTLPHFGPSQLNTQHSHGSHNFRSQGNRRTGDFSDVPA